MTRLPLESWNIKPLEGGGYVGNAVCAAPGCQIVAEERHHIWRRSFLGGDFWWVRLPDGAVTGNCVFLCAEHHRRLTVGEATLTYDGAAFTWGDAHGARLLRWQPPFYEDRTAWENHDPKLPEKNEPFPGLCPSCGQPLPHSHPERKREKSLVRRTWSIAVPVAEQENGAEVLDVNLEHARELFCAAGLPYSKDEKARYYVLSTALALFLTHADLILDTGNSVESTRLDTGGGDAIEGPAQTQGADGRVEQTRNGEGLQPSSLPAPPSGASE